MPGLMKFTFEGADIDITMTELTDDAIINNPHPNDDVILPGFSYKGILGGFVDLTMFARGFYNEAVMSGKAKVGAWSPFVTYTYKNKNNVVTTATTTYQLSYDPAYPWGLFLTFNNNGYSSASSTSYGWLDFEDTTFPCNQLNAFVVHTKNYQNGTEYMTGFGWTMGGKIAVGGADRGGWFNQLTGTPPNDPGQTIITTAYDYTNQNWQRFGYVSSTRWSGAYHRNNQFDGAYAFCCNLDEYHPKQGDDEMDLTPYPDDMSIYTSPSSDSKYSDDDVEEADIESLPTTSMLDSGFLKAFLCSSQNLNDLSTFMLSDTFLNSVKKLFGNPIDYIISLHLMPCLPSYGTSTEIYVGGVGTQVNALPITNEYVTVDLGTINCDEMFHSFLDYAPTTQVSIFLPMLGIQQLSTDDVMTGSLHLVYHFNVITGEVLAQLSVTNDHLLTKTVIGEWGGSAMMQVPVTARDNDARISGLIQAGTAIGVAAAVGSPAAGVGAAAASVSALMAKPNVSRSGNVGGSIGMLGKFTPYIIKQRPKTAIPSTFKALKGYASCMGGKIGSFDGYLEVNSVDLSGVACTDAERDEILQLLQEGVFV